MQHKTQNTHATNAKCKTHNTQNAQHANCMFKMQNQKALSSEPAISLNAKTKNAGMQTASQCKTQKGKTQSKRKMQNAKCTKRPC